MKFIRNAKVFRGQLDAAPFAGILFLLILFLLLNSSLVFIPGVPIELPATVEGEFPGLEGPTLVVAIDLRGQYYCDHQLIREAALETRLKTAAQLAKNLVLVIHSDKEAKVDPLIHLSKLARDSGIRQVVVASRPVMFSEGAAAETSTNGVAR